jgi:LysM domain
MMRSSTQHAALAAITVSGLFIPGLAWAQAGPTPAPAAPGNNDTAAPAAPAAPTTPSVPSPVTGFGFGNPQSPNGTIGGGNATESSAHPVTGDGEDTFDLGNKGGSAGAVHGDQNGPVFTGGIGFGGFGGGEVPSSHIVRRGDTLWGICGYYFENPYQWPRVWSYNPQIHNPHWIYPGDEVRLREAGSAGDAAKAGEPKAALPYTGSGMSLVDRRRQVPVGTVFLRDQGWIRDPNDEVWGDITGANADKMFLSDLDEVYLHIDKGHDVHIGQELTIFRPLHMAKAGTIVQIAGTARIDQWDSRDRVARAQVVESLNVIERGAKVGPLSRRFDIVPPRRNETEVHGHAVATLHPNEFFGQHQIVFLDVGEEKGLKVGNRLFVIHHGDAWRNSLIESHAGDRVSPDDETPMPPMEGTPGSRSDEAHYPDEIVAEMRVVSVKKDSATCLVTSSRTEIEYGDNVVARKGY